MKKCKDCYLSACFISVVRVRQRENERLWVSPAWCGNPSWFVQMGVEWDTTHWHAGDVLCTARNIRNMHFTCWVFFQVSEQYQYQPSKAVSNIQENAGALTKWALIKKAIWLLLSWHVWLPIPADTTTRRERGIPLCYIAKASQEPWSLLWFMWALRCAPGNHNAMHANGGYLRRPWMSLWHPDTWLWLCCLSSPLTLGWVEGEMSHLFGLSCPSSTTLTLKV